MVACCKQVSYCAECIAYRLTLRVASSFPHLAQVYLNSLLGNCSQGIAYPAIFISVSSPQEAPVHLLS